MKSILITETPTECRDCPCFGSNDFGVYCGATDKELIYNYDTYEFLKPEWCPLIPLPNALERYCAQVEILKHAQDKKDNIYELNEGNL